MIEYGAKDRKYEERVVWVCLAAGMLISGWAVGRVVGREPPPPPMAESVLVERLMALEARAEAEAKRRCLAVTTDKLEFTVYQTPNLGVHKVKP